MGNDVVFGANAVREALRARGRVNRLYLAQESRARDAVALAGLARAQGVRFDFVPQAKLNALAGTHEHQGVVARVSPVEYAVLDEWLGACPARALLLVLDQVQHPKNVGLLLRTALGAGAAGVLMPARGGALLDESIVRSSAGAVFHIPVITCRNLAQALRKVRDAGFWAYGLDASGEASVFETDWPARCALVLGNETRGLRPGVRKVCDALVRIPLAGGLESLNAAVAAGVALFQVAARHGAMGERPAGSD
ncbi:MAG: 23S rRNA (guanosine(2251)-2'-O)-methyltransferase RlmB [Candidatus Hydrogenedentes bacterium]|nr:23S rRNA (guanosine(2251)-2'-O)-methyltransferase RlmB [Candidatus Hydrogenedentota bacterium]